MKRLNVIIEDTRNKPDKNAHIKEQLEQLGYKVVRSKLYVGDYQFANDGSVVIDTKQDLSEVCSNLVQSHERFRNECLRAKEAGVQLIVLIADEHISDLTGVFGWKNPRRFYSKRATTGRTLGKIMYKMRDEYGVQWAFATRDNIGNKLVTLLGGDPNAV